MTKRINNDLKNEELDSILYDGNNKIILESLKDYNEWYAYKRINSVTKDVLFKQSKNISEYLKEKQIGDTVYRKNDRVMQIKNNYDIFWEKDENTYESGMGVFNGELGTIIKKIILIYYLFYIY